jgi:hypothetical protein
VPEPVFITSWRFSIDLAELRKKRLLPVVRARFIEAYERMHAEYGFLASWTERRAKHWHQRNEGNSTVEQYLGDEPMLACPGCTGSRCSARVT